MKLNNSNSIGRRISIGYSLVIGIALITSAFSIYQREMNRSRFNSISGVHLPAVNNLKDLKVALNDTKKGIHDWIFQYNEEGAQQLRDIQSKLYPEIRKNLSELILNKGIIETEDIVSALVRFDSINASAKKIMNILVIPADYENDSIMEIALGIHEGEIIPRVKMEETQLSKILTIENTALTELEEELKSSQLFLTYTMLASIMLILIVGVYAARLSTKSISVPLVDLKDSIVKLGQGEIPEVSETDRRDEIGEMANAVVSMTNSIKLKAEFATETGRGNYNINFKLLSEKDVLGLALLEMKEDLKNNSLKEKDRSWMNNGVTQINEVLRKYQDRHSELYQNLINFLCRYLNAGVGCIYVLRQSVEQRNIKLVFEAGYAIDINGALFKEVRIGEGWVGQVAAEQKTIYTSNIPENYLKISSAFGISKPRHITIFPLVFEGEIKGVVELGSFSDFSEPQKLFLTNASQIIASSLDLIVRKQHTETLLRESQELNTRLQAQEEELKVSNEELMEKTSLLQVSEQELKVQQEELIQSNAQLEEKAKLLAEQNEELELAREALRIKADELEMASRYKSEFLANMSHELRTPLNSILILANLLAENKGKNLTEKQIEYARVINRSGSDLLGLINDILDLSKIESRKIDLEISKFNFTDMAYNMESLFVEVGKSKKIDFSVSLDKNLPKSFSSDKLRIEQVIKNLLSNAFKFTPAEGNIQLKIFKAAPDRKFRSEKLQASSSNICFEVKDSGIGIPKEKQALIFEAFQEADGSTSRRYGGTGLGLSISRELSFMLGGEIQIESVPGQGSSFILILPEDFFKGQEVILDEPSTDSEKPTQAISTETIEVIEKTEKPDQKKIDEEKISQLKPAPVREKKLILIVEDDEDFSALLKEIAIEKGFDVMAENRGDKGFETAVEIIPDAIILDIGLPVMDGWTVLKKLKADKSTEHIPVHILSANENIKKGKELGAVAFLQKPINTDELQKIFESLKNADKVKSVLIVEDNKDYSESIVSLMQGKKLKTKVAETGKDALKILDEGKIDLIILDLMLPDTSGFDWLKLLRSNPDRLNIPVIVYTAQNLTEKENNLLKELSNAIILKSGKSSQRLLDETSLFLNKIDAGKITMIAKGNSKNAPNLEEALKGKKVLLVDDDMRNIFAISNFLERYELDIIVANDGREALEQLEKNPETQIVLMDIMMPEMDGYEAMTKIRENPKNKNLPIIALTAKAMKGDKEKCIECGASDYISKPIDTDKLASLMRVWLSK